VATQSTASSTCLLENGSGKTSPKNQRAKPGRSRRQYSALKRPQPTSLRTGPSNGGVQQAGASSAIRTDGPTKTAPATRPGWSVASWSSTRPPIDSPTQTAAEVSVASRTATASATSSSSE
jgi:hypothetical protein